MQVRALDVFKGATQGSLTQWHMTLVACFAPDRVNEAEDIVSTVPCSVAELNPSAEEESEATGVVSEHAPACKGYGLDGQKRHSSLAQETTSMHRRMFDSLAGI